MMKKFASIPLRISPFFWLLALAISILNNMTTAGFDWAGACIWVFVIIVSVTFHEYGHAITAVAFGQQAQIDLVGFGGVTKRVGPKLSSWKEFLIVLNGPLAGSILCALSFAALYILGPKIPYLFRYTLFISYYANLFWTVVNLLPIHPLDGGQLIKIFFEGTMGVRGVKIALFISFAASVLVSLGFLVSGFFLLGAFFLIFTYESFRSWKNSLELKDQDRDLSLQVELKEAQRNLENGLTEQALAKLSSVRDKAREGVLFVTATYLYAEGLSEQGRYSEAYQALYPLRKKLGSESLRLLHQLAFRCREWEEAAALGNSAYQSYPGYETALINALSYGMLGKAKPAIGWLQCAVKEGLPDLEQILTKREFDSIRTDPLFLKMKEQN